MNFDEDTLLLLLAVCIYQTVVSCQLSFKKPKKRKLRVRKWLRCREMLGGYNTIALELELQDRYHNNSFWFV